MDVQDVMSTHVHKIQGTETASKAAEQMREADVGTLVVLTQDAVEGTITDRDLTIRCMSQGHNAQECRVSLHMSSPVVSVSPTLDMLEAAHKMTEQNVRRLPVMQDGELLGLVSLFDIAFVFDIALESMDRTLHDLLRGMGAIRSA